jgi:hypothetical protein
MGEAYVNKYILFCVKRFLLENNLQKETQPYGVGLAKGCYPKGGFVSHRSRNA